MRPPSNGDDRPGETAGSTGEKPGPRIVFESSEDVRIDEQGRIFRFNGERILANGHEPERILRSLADLKAGRVLPLDEIRTRRR